MSYEELVNHFYAHVRMLGISHAEKTIKREFPEKANDILTDVIERLKKEFPKTDVEKTFR